MTDRELLEMAAKAAGIEIPDGCEFFAPEYWKHEATNTHIIWNPLGEDGDALRLAVKLNIGVFKDVLGVYCNFNSVKQVRVYFECNPCEYSATRLAIVKAAAEIGISMKGTK